MAQCGGLLATEGITGLLLVGAIDCFIGAHRLETSVCLEQCIVSECTVRLL